MPGRSPFPAAVSTRGRRPGGGGAARGRGGGGLAAPSRRCAWGRSNPYETGTGFSIRPVVGIIPPGLLLTPHEREVAEVFHVPFAHVLDVANHQRRSGEWQGRTRHFYVIPYEGREIWGATAAILVNLARTLS